MNRIRFAAFGHTNVLIILAAILTASSSYVAADTNILTNPGFESGTTGWTSRSCSISTVTSPAPHGGTYSARAYNRTQTWHGIQQNVLNKMVIGQTYQISGWVRISAASGTVKVTIQKTDGSGTTYANVATGNANNSGWIQISGNYTLTVNGTLTELLVYFEGPDSGVDIYVDDAVVYGPEPLPAGSDATGQVNVNTRHQIIEGFGAAGAWYEGTLVSLGSSQPQIYNVLFRDLGLDIYRLRNAYDQSGGTGYMSASAQIIANGEASLGRPLKVLISCWSPPASLKSNNNTVGGTLAGGPSNYVYTQLGDWWADSITAWAGYGVDANYISIQNEPDYSADWDTCRYEPSQTTSYAGYNQAFEAIYNEIYSRMGASMPKMIAPEATGFNGASGSSLSTYLSAIINHSHVYGYAHHLYNINAGDNPDGYLTAMQNFNAAWGSKPLFQTEYEKAAGAWPDALNLAHLLHNSLTVEETSGYLYWDLFWGDGGLVSISASSYTINSDYWGFKHFSAFVHSGWQRVEASENSADLRMSAYISPDNSKMSVVIINTSTADVNLELSFDSFTIGSGSIYRTTQSQNCVNLGSFNPANPMTIPAKSITTLSLSGSTGAICTLSASSTAGGSVTTPGEGNFQYAEGLNVNISAGSDPYYHFTNWTGSAVTAGKVGNPAAADSNVLMDANYSLVANFQADPPDTTPPSPNPMTWSAIPLAISSSSIKMTATTATDIYMPVQYYFECTTDGSKNSDWQTSPTYVAQNLNPSTQYSFRVKARDNYLTPNETGLSDIASATTPSGPLVWDDFETGGWTGGNGWSGNWTYSGDSIVTTAGAPYEGSYHLRQRTGTGIATRTVNMTGVSNAYLSFRYRADSFESGDYATVEVYDGSWNTVLTVNSTTPYTLNDIDLSGFDMISGFQIRFASHMNSTFDQFYIDDIEINGSSVPQNCTQVQSAGYRLLSDLNGDCYVNFADLFIISDYWLNDNCAVNNNCEGADFVPTNGEVDFHDFGSFANQWMQCNNPQGEGCITNW